MLLMIGQCGIDYCWMGRASWRPGLLDTIGRVVAQAVVCHRRLRLDIYLRILRLELEGGIRGSGGGRVCEGRVGRGDQVGWELRRRDPHGSVDEEGSRETSVPARQRIQGQRSMS